MPNVTSREGLKDYCLRKLGFPVIEVNVDDDQVEERIDDAFQFFFDYHYDGVEKTYHAAQLTQQDIDNGYVTVPDSLIGVIRVLPFSSGRFQPMGDATLAFDSSMSSPLSGLAGSSRVGFSMVDQTGGGTRFDKTSFYLAMANYEDLGRMFAAERPIRFNRHTNRVYVDIDWAEDAQVDDYLMIEGWSALDPEVYTDVYNDRWLKRYATALIKQQWGANLKKYSGIQLPGGVTLDGDKMYDEATQEIGQLEEEMQLKYEEPPQFFMG